MIRPLGEFITLAPEYVPVSSAETYPMAGVLSYGRGLFRRPDQEGSSSSYKTFHRLRTDSLVLSQLFGWEGAVALVPSAFDGVFVSSHFPTYELSPEILPGYAELLCQSPQLWHQLDRQATGLGLRRRTLKPDSLLSCTAWIPAIGEQERILRLAQRALVLISESCLNHDGVQQTCEALLIAMSHRDDLTEDEKAARGWRRVRLGDVMRLDLDPVKVDPLLRYKTAGCYSYARGLFHKEPVSGLEYQSPFLYRMKTGQFTYLKLKAFEGSFAFVSDEFEGCCVSNEYPMFTMDSSKARAEWLFAYFKAPRTWAGLASSSKGIGARRERVNPTAMLAHEVWLPPMAEQNKIAEVLNAKRQYDALDTFEKDAEALRRSILSEAFRGEL